MPVSITMRVTETSVDSANNRSYVNVVVTANYTGGSFNRNDPPLTVTLDGVSETVGVDFNAGQATSGSEVIYNQTWFVGHNTDGSKTLYYSASYVTGVSSGTVSTSGSLVLTKLPGSSGGDSGDTGGGDSGDTGGGDSGGSEGGDSGGGSQTAKCYVDYILAPHSSVDVYQVISETYNSFIRTLTSSGFAIFNPTYSGILRFIFNADEGYVLTECKKDGEICEQNFTFGVSGTKEIMLESNVAPSSYLLSMSTTEGVNVSVTRVSSEATTTIAGQLHNGSTIYHNDVVRVEFSCVSGYILDTCTVNGVAFTSGDTITVTGNLTVSASAKRNGTPQTAHIDNGVGLVGYLVCVEDGLVWNEYSECVDTGSSWEEIT